MLWRTAPRAFGKRKRVRSLPELRLLPKDEGEVWVALFSPDGRRVLAAGDRGAAQIWDAKDWQPLHVLSGHTQTIEQAAFSPDSKLVVTASWDGTTRIWAVDSGREVTRLVGRAGKVATVAFSPRGDRIVAAFEDPVAQLFAQDGKEIAELSLHTKTIRHGANCNFI